MTEERNEKYEKVRNYYKNHLWTLDQVRNAVGKWITREEFEEITGEMFE